jgi:nitrogen-specific signal transduction histidine kinase
VSFEITKSELIKRLPGRKFFAVWGIALLLGGLVCFLMVDNFRSRLKLQQINKQEFLHYTENIATGLVYFFEERTYELNTLAGSRIITTYFENQAMGMSMEYGLKASLASAQESFCDILKQRKIADISIYQCFMLVGRDGKTLLDCSWTGQKPGKSPAELRSVFDGKPKASILLLENNDHSYVVMSVPCYFKGDYVATLLTIVNPDSVIHQMGNRDNFSGKNLLILDSRSKSLVNKDPVTTAYLSKFRNTTASFPEKLFYSEDKNRNLFLFVNIPIPGTPFCVLNSIAGDYFDTGNPWKMLSAMVMLAVVLFGGGIFIYRSAARNLILQVRLEEKNNQQQMLEQVNLQLKREVSQRRQNEILLSEKETLLWATLESTTEGILVINRNGQIASWNRSFREIWKLPEMKPLVTLPEMKEFFLERTQHSESFINEFCALQEGAERFSGTLTLQSGSVIEYCACPMKVCEAIQGCVWTFRDITIHKNAERTLQIAKEAAEKSNKSKTEFLTNMSHELRTPLNSIIGFSTVLNEEPLDDSQKTYVGNIYKSGISLLEMLDNLLLYSDIEADSVSKELQQCSLRDIVDCAKNKVWAKVQNKGLHLDIVCEKETPAVFYSDSQKITKILTAILDNACKFTDRGSICLAISPVCRDHQYWIQFTVKDTGIGIPADKLQDIFEAFMQADGSMTRKYGGIGTGLAIAQKLTELLGGEIQVQSEQGKGTTFTVTLPIYEASEIQPQSIPQPVMQTAGTGNSVSSLK